MDDRTRYLNAREVLRGAIKFFETHDLLKNGQYYDSERSKACIIGSLVIAREAIPELANLVFRKEGRLVGTDPADLVRQQFLNDHGYGQSITQWNDHSATKEQVVALLKKTLRNGKKLWEETRRVRHY